LTPKKVNLKQAHLIVHLVCFRFALYNCFTDHCIEEKRPRMY
jgi:hypothetical protein